MSLKREKLEQIFKMYNDIRKYVNQHSNHELNEEILLQIFLLFLKYNKMQLKISEVIEELELSLSTLERMRREKQGLSYTKNKSRGRNGAIRYPLTAVATYMIETKVQVC